MDSLIHKFNLIMEEASLPHYYQHPDNYRILTRELNELQLPGRHTFYWEDDEDLGNSAQIFVKLVHFFWCYYPELHGRLTLRAACGIKLAYINADNTATNDYRDATAKICDALVKFNERD